MYGLIYLDRAPSDPPKLSMFITVPTWNMVTSKPITGDARSRRSAEIMLFVNKWAKDQAPSFRNGLMQDLMQLADWVPQPEWPVAMDMWLAHAHLEPEIQKARKAAIDRFIAAEIPVVPLSRMAMMERIRHGSLLIPDAIMETELRLWCCELRQLLLKDGPETDAPEDCARYALLTTITKQCKNRDGTRTKLGDALVSMAYTRSLRDLDGLIAIAPRLIQEGCEELIAAAEAVIKSTEYQDLSSIFIDDARTEMMKAAVGSPSNTDWPAFVVPYLAKARALSTSLRARVFWTTQQALERGVAMGESGTQSLAALRDWSSKVGAIHQEMESRSILKQPQGAHATPTRTALDDGSVDIDPVWSWAVDRLAQWIEGPVAETAHNAVDRHKIVDHETTAAQAQTVSHDQKPGKPMTVDDIGEVIQKGLCATAQFFADELHDLLPLAKQLDVPQALIDKSNEMCGPLLALATINKPVDEVPARNLLQDAEAHIQGLRSSLKSAQASAAVQSRFPFEFEKALRNESITLGKRHGGVIKCPVTAQDWSYVVANFHRRWLPNLQSIEIAGATWPLTSDQALGLYVTASSQSAYAFDVSVHLWRRRHGKSSLPSLEDGSLPPMNTEDWFDTYVPCCVLHVPAHKK